MWDWQREKRALCAGASWAAVGEETREWHFWVLGEAERGARMRRGQSLILFSLQAGGHGGSWIGCLVCALGCDPGSPGVLWEAGRGVGAAVGELLLPAKRCIMRSGGAYRSAAEYRQRCFQLCKCDSTEYAKHQYQWRTEHTHSQRGSHVQCPQADSDAADADACAGCKLSRNTQQHDTMSQISIHMALKAGMSWAGAIMSWHSTADTNAVTDWGLTLRWSSWVYLLG